MALLMIPDLPNASFSQVILTRLYPSNPDVILKSYWSPFTTTLYLAVREKDGHVAAWIYHDRKVRPDEVTNFRSVSEWNEDDGPAHIHCPPEFIAALSPARTTKAQVWRDCCNNWFRNYRVLLDAAAVAPPRGRVKLFSPKSSAPHFEAEVNQFGGFAGKKWPDTLTLVRCLGAGYIMLVQPAPAEGKA